MGARRARSCHGELREGVLLSLTSGKPSLAFTALDVIVLFRPLLKTNTPHFEVVCLLASSMYLVAGSKYENVVLFLQSHVPSRNLWIMLAQKATFIIVGFFSGREDTVRI